jgi:hypothetical protein
MLAQQKKYLRSHSRPVNKELVIFTFVIFREKAELSTAARTLALTADAPDKLSVGRSDITNVNDFTLGLGFAPAETVTFLTLTGATRAHLIGGSFTFDLLGGGGGNKSHESNMQLHPVRQSNVLTVSG